MHFNGIDAESDDQLTTQIKTLMGKFRAIHMGMIIACKREHNVNFHNVAVLHQIARKGSMTVGEISHFLDVSSAAVSQSLDKLVHTGFVLRVENPNDRREKLLKLSNQGNDLINELHSRGTMWIEELRSSLTENEKDKLTNCLVLMNSKLEHMEIAAAEPELNIPKKEEKQC
jgi:DNA-binding MarR family transcriptional regulator